MDADAEEAGWEMIGECIFWVRLLLLLCGPKMEDEGGDEGS